MKKPTVTKEQGLKMIAKAKDDFVYELFNKYLGYNKEAVNKFGQQERIKVLTQSYVDYFYLDKTFIFAIAQIWEKNDETKSMKFYFKDVTEEILKKMA